MLPADAFRRTFSGRPLKRSILVAVVVGTLLNIINQGPEMLAGHTAILWKLILTYSVPFAVASYGAYSAFRTTE